MSGSTLLGDADQCDAGTPEVRKLITVQLNDGPEGFCGPMLANVQRNGFKLFSSHDLLFGARTCFAALALARGFARGFRSRLATAFGAGAGLVL